MGIFFYVILFFQEAKHRLVHIHYTMKLQWAEVFLVLTHPVSESGKCLKYIDTFPPSVTLAKMMALNEFYTLLKM